MNQYYISTSFLIARALSSNYTVSGQNEKYSNVLLIMTDQQAWDAIGYAGNKIMKTPNLDRLANEGVNFSQAIHSVQLVRKQTAKELRSKLMGYLKDVNSPLVKGIEERILVN